MSDVQEATQNSTRTGDTWWSAQAYGYTTSEARPRQSLLTLQAPNSLPSHPYPTPPHSLMPSLSAPDLDLGSSGVRANPTAAPKPPAGPFPSSRVKKITVKGDSSRLGMGIGPKAWVHTFETDGIEVEGENSTVMLASELFPQPAPQYYPAAAYQQYDPPPRRHSWQGHSREHPDGPPSPRPQEQPTAHALPPQEQPTEASKSPPPSPQAQQDSNDTIGERKDDAEMGGMDEVATLVDDNYSFSSPASTSTDGEYQAASPLYQQLHLQQQHGLYLPQVPVMDPTI